MSATDTAAVPLHWSSTAARARDDGRPLVALETTVLAHGLPYPGNLESAVRMEEAVRAGGAEPVLIGIADGAIQIGIEGALLERFARGDGVAKASPRDLGVLLAMRRDGATTVAGTLACAAMAGIEVFATGGIGGVHPGFASAHDVSADLPALGRYPLLTVASGAKSVLDLPRTLEALETLGVPVLGFGTGQFPAFYTRDSGLAASASVSNAAEAAAAFQAQRALTGAGVLLANPVPASAALDEAELGGWLSAAHEAAAAAGVKGAAVTPFLLSHLHEHSGGKSLAANIALLVDNARVAGEVAAAL